jgi:hypothetical protein
MCPVVLLDRDRLYVIRDRSRSSLILCSRARQRASALQTQRRQQTRQTGMHRRGRPAPTIPPYSSPVPPSAFTANSSMYRIPRSRIGAISGSVSPPFFGLYASTGAFTNFRTRLSSE